MANHYKFTSKGLHQAKSIVDAINTLGGRARIGLTYMDYGAEITWETILVESKSLKIEYQALSPRDFEEINSGEFSVEKVKELVKQAVES